jgi:hypothetical protein
LYVCLHVCHFISILSFYIKCLNFYISFMLLSLSYSFHTINNNNCRMAFFRCWACIQKKTFLFCFAYKLNIIKVIHVASIHLQVLNLHKFNVKSSSLLFSILNAAWVHAQTNFDSHESSMLFFWYFMMHTNIIFSCMAQKNVEN